MLIVAATDHAGSMKCMCYLIYMHARFKRFNPYSVLALLIICCSDNGIKPIAYYWSTSCGNFLDINSYRSNNITS